MDAKIFRINYKSDFILTLTSDAGWMTPFCIKFWTGAPSQAYYVSWDGETYTHCTYDPSEPTKLTVQFDDHHLPIGDLKFQVAYHFTVADFPNDTEDEVINQANITTEIDGETYKVMLDFTGETAPEIQFSLPAYANEAQRIANEQQRIANEQQRIANEQQRIQQENARVEEFNSIKNTAQSDHRRAESDHSTAVNDHTRAESDHRTAADDHTQAGNDHTRAESDHTQAGNDHTRAESDHTQAGNDHTRAESDHTQAGNDHTRAESDHTQAGNDHTRAESDHTQAGNDHTRAESDHTRAENDHAAVEVFIDSLGAFDISAYHASGGVLAKYADLQAALGTGGANIPESLRKGGMSVKFVQTDDNKYVQFRCMAQSFTTDVTQWQGVDDVPTAESDNLAKSGGINKFVAEVNSIGKKELSLTGFYGYTTKNWYKLNPDGTIKAQTYSSKHRTNYTNTPVSKNSILVFTGTCDTSGKAFAIGISSVPITDENITSVQITILSYKIYPVGDMSETIVVPFDGYIVFYRYTDYWTNVILRIKNVPILPDNSVLDVSELNNTNYNSLSEAITAIPETLQKGGMEIRFKQITPATYTVVKTEGVETQPTGTEVQEALSLESGTYTAAQMAGVTPPESGSVTYYLAVTETIDEQEVTTYTTWVITLASPESLKYVQKRSMTTSWSSAVADWQGVDEEPTIGSKNLVESSGVFFGTRVTNDITPLNSVSSWKCSSSSYATFLLDDTGYNGTWNLLRKSSNFYRIYMDCTNLKNGTTYKISFDFETSNGLSLTSIGYGVTHSGDWKNLKDLKTGSTVYTNPGKIEFTFKKDETLNYIFIAYDIDRLTFPMTATVRNFSIGEVLAVTETALNNKEDITLLKRKNLRSQYIEKEDITNLMVWQTNNESVWNIDTSEEGAVILTNINKTGKTYCGFDISSIDDGTLIKLCFKTYANIKSSAIGGFVALASQGWASLKDVSGEVITKDEEGYLTIIFRKESSVNWIVFASGSFSSGTKIGIRDYSLHTVKNLLIDMYLPPVSSIIPPNYTYETYMSLNSSFSTGGSGQGSCIYENTFVYASTTNSSGEMEIKFYDLQNKSLLQSIVLTGITNVQTHANSISFGNKYDENDPLPLLYIPSGYVMSGTQDGQVYVYRFAGTIGELTATLVQVITLKDVNSWTEWICDANNNRAWVKNGANNFTCYNIPSTEESEAIIDETTPIIDNFTLPQQTYSSSVTKSSLQGHVYNKGRIWVCAGVPSRTAEGPESCCIFTINVRSKCRESVVWLEDVGLTNGTSNTYEPEGIFIWNNQLYVAYRTFIAKIVKVDLT